MRELKFSSSWLAIIACLMICSTHLAKAEGEKLNGICYYQNEDDYCTVYSSLEGGAIMQIRGEGFIGTAQDQSVLFSYSGVAIPGDSINKEQNFNSDIKRGIVYYDSPSLDSLFGEAISSEMASAQTEVFMEGYDLKGRSVSYACETSSHCTLNYGIAYTPQINRIYPSTVFSGMDICLNVFTDYATGDNHARAAYNKTLIGESTLNFDEYFDNNYEAVSTWSDYQLCGKAGGAIAAEDNDITIIADVGKYLLTDFAKSYDGTNTYTVRTIPKVDEISLNSFYKADGKIIIIKGEGFAVNPDLNSVTVDDVECTVFEATDTQLKCQLGSKTTTTSGSWFVGGMGARGREYSGISSASSITGTSEYTNVYFTDIESRRNTDDEDSPMVRVVEYWFVPPQDGNYIFHASCDDTCTVQLSLTDMDSSAATTILTVNNYNGWRNFWKPKPSNIYSDEQALEGGKHYYMKVIHTESSGNDYMTVGFTINDTTAEHPNSYLGWKNIFINPHHEFEEYELLLPNDTATSYRIQFANSNKGCTGVSSISDVFQCTTDVCPCVSTTISVNSTAAQVKSAVRTFFNQFGNSYGDYMSVTKQMLNGSGDLTEDSAEVEQYKFTITATSVINTESSTSVRVWPSSGTTTATCTKLSNSTSSLSGSFKVSVPLSNGTSVTTADLGLNYGDGIIVREIYKVAPEYIGKIELKSNTDKYPTYYEGKDFYYRFSDSDVSLSIVDSTDNPLTGGTIGTTPIDFGPDDSYSVASNTPFYEVIPASMVRTYEIKPQLVVTSNGLTGACPTAASCDVTFVEDVSEITSYTASAPYEQMTFIGTNLVPEEIEYVAISTWRRCALDPNTDVTTTGFKCLTSNMIAGDHPVVVQSEKGAILNGGSVTNLNINIVISSIAPASLYQSGGQTITITGNYFPRDLKEANRFSDFSVTLTGGFTCVIIDVSKTEITCTAPKGLSGTPAITVAFNSKSTTSTDTFTVATSTYSVTSVNTTQICPVLKQDLDIVVSDTPSANPDDYAGVLVNDDLYTIKMRVNAVNQATKALTVRFPGSPSNSEYIVYAEYNGERFNSAVTLDVLSTITNIEITTASKSSISTTGGDTVTITGTGFSTTLSDNIVQFGDSYADVLSATSTELQVRAGSAASAGEVEVKVFLKLSIEPTCEIGGGCKITYDDTQAPTVTTSNPVSVVDGTVTVEGSGFGNTAVAFIGDYAQEVLSVTDSQIQVKLTQYDDNEAISLVIRTSVNLPTIILDLPIAPQLVSVSPQIGSSGGQLITLTVNGLSMAHDSDLNVYYGSGLSKTQVCDSADLIDSNTVQCVTANDLEISSTQALKLSYVHKSSQTGKTSTIYLSCTQTGNCNYNTSSDNTPSIDSVSTPSDDVLELSISGFTFDNTYTITIYYESMEIVGTYIDATTVQGTNSQGFPPGVSDIRVSFEKDGSITFSSSISQSIPLSASMVGPVDCSWAGGCALEFGQASILQGAQAGDISVTVCGQEADLMLDISTNDNLVAYAPLYSTSHSLESFMVEEAQVITGTYSSNPAGQANNAFDGRTTTQFKSASIDDCWVKVAFESGKVGSVDKVKYFMNRMTDKQANFVGHLKFQASTDDSTWNDIFAADTYLREGWNEYEPDSTLNYQYYRFYSATSKACQIAEIELWGNVVELSSSTTKSCDVVLTAPGGETQTFLDQVVYSDAASSVVTSISPRYGTYKGGETVTFTGTGFSTTSSEISITIDGIDCPVDSATSTQITCTTGARPEISSNPSTILRFEGSNQNGYASMQSLRYKYANYWSDLDTWSGEYLPQTGDSVSIPAGQTLIVDVNSTPVLKAIVVEGALIFAPDSNPNHHRTFDAEYIFVYEGAVFEAGTETDRYTSKLTITMHGTRESPQLPVYGNKGIFVRRGTLDIHGVERDTTWTELATTVEAGQNTITLNAKVDWAVGEEIVIAPTDFEVDHAEPFEITAVDNSGSNTVLTLNTTTLYKHYSGSKDYTGSNGVNSDMTKTLEMRAEVGLLTRNVVYKGADDDSVANKYGAHIMLHSSGDDSLTGRISYVEFKQVGQAFQLGRYPIHFHLIGNVHNSYIRGNAIHHTYNRACTIHGVHYLTIEKNVAYETMGHTFFIEDAVETKNSLHHNLAIKTKRSWSLLMTDQSPASFWITHPDNQFVGNHAAGSDRYGFWFDLQTHSTGPSFDPNVCPEFEVLGEFTGNVAHSNGRYGLRIFHRFTPTDNACAALETNAHELREQPDPSIAAPVVAHFRDFLGYKNKRSGIIAEELGALKFHDIKTADNLLSGFELGITAAGPWLTSSDDYHLQDSLIVGFSDNAEEEQLTHEDVLTTRGLKGARTEKMRIKDTIFAGFDYDGKTWGAIGTCSHCDTPATDSSGRTYHMKNLYFVNSTQRVTFDTPFKEIIYDEDGTLGNSTHRWIVHYFKHLDIPECERNEETYNGLLCDNSLQIRRVAFHNPTPLNALKGLPMKIMNTQSIQGTRRRSLVSPASCSGYGSNSLSTLEGWDSDTYHVQQLLLEAYNDYRVKTNQYTAYVTEAEENNNSTAASLAATLSTEIDTLLTSISTYEDQVDNNYGAYDDLWKSDSNFCDTENYEYFEYRKKANPFHNWVIPLATGYEYKVHFAQGEDFEELNGIYSYAELIENDDKAIVLHFNHTERTEMFYLNYTHSSTGTKVSSNLLSVPANLGNSGSMGDIYMNNVTRHMTLKLDNSNTDALEFVLEREECITVGGCNNKDMPEDAEIEAEFRYWSNPKHWSDDRSSGSKPTNGSQVIIGSTWNMVMDDPDVADLVFESIEINGRLSFPNDTETYTLNSYLIYVRKGELIVGYEESPIQGKVVFNLYGERDDRDVYFHDKMFEGGNKVIANTGKLRMYGKPVTPKWTRLAEVAPAGQSWIVVTDEPTDWAVGDQLGIAPSGRDYTHRDAVTIADIDGNNITLTSSLNYEHYGAFAHNSSATSSIDIRAEVLHLTRNIVVQGTNADEWGGHIVTAHNTDSGFVDGQLVTINRYGHAIIDHVEFNNCSQYDTDKAAVRFANIDGLGDDDTRSSVTNSAIHDGLGIGIMVTSAEDVTVDSNVVWYTHIGGIWMKASHNTTITNNVVAGMGTRYWSSDNRLDEIGGYILCNKDQNCKNLVVKNNIMGGFERAGFVLPTLNCAETSNYENNLVHSVQHGAWILKNKLLKEHCFSGFRAYKTEEEGVISFQQFELKNGCNEASCGKITVSDIEVLDCGIGVTLEISGEYEHNQVILKDSVIMGQSNLLPTDSKSKCIDVYGVWLPSTSEKTKQYPITALCNWPFHKPVSDANWVTEAFNYNVTFKNWESGVRSCNNSKMNRAIGINDEATDHVPVCVYQDTVFDNVNHTAVTYLYDPPERWVDIDHCGEFPCSGPENVVIKFLNAKSTGYLTPNVQDLSNGVDFTILANNYDAVSYIDNCTRDSDWNGYRCFNMDIAQVMFESLDEDRLDRMISPIYVTDDGSDFNNTLNSFREHCWDGAYACQKRLSRFPSVVQINKKYELYYTGTQPSDTRYRMLGATSSDDYLHLQIDFSQSRLYNVYADNVLVDANKFNETSLTQTPLQYTSCGENIYEKPTYIYEFYLTYGCTVKFQSRNFLEMRVRLQVNYSSFYTNGGRATLMDKIASALGITQDTIRIVNTESGSTIVDFYISCTDESNSDECIEELKELRDETIARYKGGDSTLDFGYPILELIATVHSADGSVISDNSDDETYEKKEISTVVYVFLAFACLAVVVGLGVGFYKAVSMARSYRTVADLDPSDYEKGHNKSEMADDSDFKHNHQVAEENKEMHLYK